MIHVGDMLQKKRRKKAVVISSCTSSSVLLRSGRTCRSNTKCASTDMRSQCLNSLLQRKKARDTGCDVDVNTKKRGQTWIKQQLQIPSGFQSRDFDWELTWLGVEEEPPPPQPPHPIWLTQTIELFATLWHRSARSGYKPLAVAMSHVNHTHTHTHTQIKPKLITTMNSFLQDLNTGVAKVQSVQPINIFLLQKRGR